MSFDATRWPNAVTIGSLIEDGMQMEAHCHRCGRFALLDPASVGLPSDTPVPALEGHFRCRRCGSRETSARPHFPSDGPSGYSDASVAAAQATTAP